MIKPHCSALVFLALCASLPAQVSDARYAKLARGVNFNTIYQYGGSVMIGAQDLDLIKSSGFTCIRLPIAPDYILPSLASSATITSNLAKIDATVDLFLKAGIAVMLDFHNDGTYFDYYISQPTTAKSEMIAMW